MEIENLLQKLNSIQKAPPAVIFGYRYYHSKLDGYVALTNLRLEILQINNGSVLYTLAAPVLEIRHGKSFIEFHDKDLVLPLEGPRTGILLRHCYLNENEAASPAPNCESVEITADSDFKHLQRVIDMYERPAYPGIDMRLPPFFRCTKNPSRLRLNYVPELLEALGLPSGASADTLKEAFMQNIHSVAYPTSEGWVVPFDWVYAGGMVVCPAADLGKAKPKIQYIRSVDFFRNFIRAKSWGIICA